MRKHFICIVEGCGKPHLAKGFCNSHWVRWKRYGTPLGGRNALCTPRKFFYETVLTYKGHDCLEWPFSKNQTGGYGIFYHKNTAGVHRAVCLEVYGDPPTASHQAAHSCGNTSCCNPNHLRWATRSENEKDKIVHGTSNRGERHGMSRLTVSQVEYIRSRRYKTTSKKLAPHFGISHRTVLDIWQGTVWRWLPYKVSHKVSCFHCSAKAELYFTLDEKEDVDAAMAEVGDICKAHALALVSTKK